MAENKPKPLGKGLLEMLEKQEHCDILFNVDGDIIGAHRVVLKFRGEALYNMAAGWNHEKEPRPIEDMTYNIFKTLLRYMYSDEIFISNDNVFPLLSASKQLKMKYVEKLCTDHIIKSIGTGNVCTYMEEAINFNSEAIKKKCLDIFSKETAQVLNTGLFKKLSQPALSAFLDVDSINVLEILLFWHVKKGMVQKCNDEGISVNGLNLRKVIGDALYKIRFPTMTTQDFANGVSTIDGFLTDSEIKQVFQKITIFDSEGIECPFSNKFRCEKSFYQTPVADVEQLCNQKVLYNWKDKQHCDFNSLLNYMKDCSNEAQIGLELLSYRLVLQCYADLENSSAIVTRANDWNQDIRNKLHDEFHVWQKTLKTENVSKIMTEFIQMKNQLNKICEWTT